MLLFKNAIHPKQLIEGYQKSNHVFGIAKIFFKKLANGFYWTWPIRLQSMRTL